VDEVLGVSLGRSSDARDALAETLPEVMRERGIDADRSGLRAVRAIIRFNGEEERASQDVLEADEA
jgi:hypothetical protein